VESGIPDPPRGLARLAWLGPGFLWMVSAAGSGELLFTPRVGALYGYQLLWAMLAAVALKWFINREIGRFAVCTGQSILEGFATLPGPGCWAVWLILLPQAVVAVAAIAGLAGSAATALTLVLPGDIRIWMIASVLASTALVVIGRYRVVEATAAVIGVALAAAAIVAALSVGVAPADVAAGLVPRMPENVNYGEILPWLGFMLSGAAGLMWYSYWIVAKGYGASGSVAPVEDPQQRAKLRGWLGQMTFDCSVAVAGTLLIAVAFLILGTELLQPRGLVPEENRVAEVLGELLGGVFGPIGFWFMIVAVFVGFWDTVLSDQDGHGRLFANGTRLLRGSLSARARSLDEERLRQVFVLVLVTLLPIGLYLVAGQPVGLLKVAGAIEAAHIPVVTGLTLYLNRTRLPAELQPSWPTFAATVLAGAFFAAFAAIYLFQASS
jgi:Mn2+/Fe2+ NRAMP family transporter